MISLRMTVQAALAALALCTAGMASPALAEAPAVTDTSAAGELAYWNLVKDSDKPDDLARYIEAFPNGMFVEPARQRFEALTGKPFAPGTVTAPEPSAPPAGQVKPAPVKKSAAARHASPRKTATVKKQKSKSVARTHKSSKIRTAAKPAKQRKAAAYVKPATKPVCSATVTSNCIAPKKKILIDLDGRAGGWN